MTQPSPVSLIVMCQEAKLRNTVPIDQSQMKQLLDRALATFFRVEADNIALGTNERNLCGRLAIHLNELLPEFGLNGYYADTEYNRNQDGQVKTILDHREVVVSINCDLILHSRGELVKGDNLIAFEMKKSTRPDQEKEDDRNRLRAMTKQSYDGVRSANGNTHPEHVCGYVIGAFIELDVNARKYVVELFERGDRVGTERGQF